MQKSPTDSTFLAASRQELPFLLDALIGSTGFFRQPEQFRFLNDVMVDHLRNNAPVPQSFLVVGGDAGADAYSLCLSLIATMKSGQPFSILATEFLPDKTTKAARAVYPQTCMRTEELQRMKQFLLRSRNRNPVQIRLRPGIRALVQFRCADIFSGFALREQMDIIFCRHVLHHFHPAIAARLAQKLAAHLAPGGLLFLGAEMQKPKTFKKIGPAIYQKI